MRTSVECESVKCEKQVQARRWSVVHTSTLHTFTLFLQIHRLSRERLHLGANRVKESAGEIALAVAGNDDDDVFAGIFRTCRNLERGKDRGARGDADEKAFFQRQTARRLDRFI